MVLGVLGKNWRDTTFSFCALLHQLSFATMSKKKTVAPKVKRETIDYDADFETHMMFRVPRNLYSYFDDYITNGQSGENGLKIKFNEHLKTGDLKIADKHLSFVVQSLPTIIEVRFSFSLCLTLRSFLQTYKTFDNVNVIKVADCSQLIKCKEETTTTAQSSTDPIADSEIVAKASYESRHGITPPMRDVKKNMFRKPKAFLPGLSKEVASKVKELLRKDLEATSVRWEVVETDESDSEGKTEGNFFFGNNNVFSFFEFKCRFTFAATPRSSSKSLGTSKNGN